MIGYYTPYLFIVRVATSEQSVPETTAVFLLSTIGTVQCFHCTHHARLLLWTSLGVSNTCVRFFSGWITKLPYMTPLLVNNIGLTVAGIVTLMVPLCRTYGLLFTYCIIWGAFIGRGFIARESSFWSVASHSSVSCLVEPGHRLSTGRSGTLQQCLRFNIDVPRYHVVNCSTRKRPYWLSLLVLMLTIECSIDHGCYTGCNGKFWYSVHYCWH